MSIPTSTLRTFPEVRSSDGRILEYLRELPRVASGDRWLPPDRVLVHSNVRPTRRLGSNGFRAWLTTPDPTRYQTCACGWAPELGEHYSVSAVAQA